MSSSNYDATLQELVNIIGGPPPGDSKQLFNDLLNIIGTDEVGAGVIGQFQKGFQSVSGTTSSASRITGALAAGENILADPRFIVGALAGLGIAPPPVTPPSPLTLVGEIDLTSAVIADPGTFKTLPLTGTIPPNSIIVGINSVTDALWVPFSDLTVGLEALDGVPSSLGSWNIVRVGGTGEYTANVPAISVPFTPTTIFATPVNNFVHTNYANLGVNPIGFQVNVTAALPLNTPSGGHTHIKLFAMPLPT
jgi:hypothetical protein